MRTILDAPCGDFNWMASLVDTFDGYAGVDIVPEIVARNRTRFAKPHIEFVCADITEDDLPSCDVILCRDCFIHLPEPLIRQAIRNCRRTGARYVLLTNDARELPYEEITRMMLASFRTRR